jgi:endonuclease/exonuclease/phosphatase family metal-dependent hydrolase
LVVVALLAGVLVAGREVRTMKNYDDPDGPLFQADFAGEPPAFTGRLRVITWNIRFAEEVETAVTELQTIPELQNADILLLQEMDERGVAQLAQELGYNYVYYPASVHSYHFRNFGNAVLSKWPILDSAKILLPYENPSNRQRRIGVRAVVDVGGEEVLAYTVHTETYWLPQGRRDAQAAAIVADIEAEAGDRPVIVGGDFNTVTAADVEGLSFIFAGAGLERASAGAGHSVTVAGLDVEADHLFARGVTTMDNGVYAETSASDHFPVWAELLVDVLIEEIPEEDHE